MLSLNAVGKLTLTDETGRDYTPRPMKARGLLVLLAVAPAHSRTRAWLQSRLWSDSEPEQASGSLRTVLTEIRRALGPYRDILIADRHAVSLDPARFRIRYGWSETESEGNEAEPFEDVDIADEEFEHLIRDLRERIRQVRPAEDAARPGPPRRVILIERDTRGGPAAAVAAQLVSEKILFALGQIGDFEVVGDEGMGAHGGAEPRHGGVPHLVSLRILVVAIDAEVFVAAELSVPRDARKLWSDSVVLPANMMALRDSVPLGKLSFTAVDRLCDAFTGGEGRYGAEASALALARQGRDLLFRLDRASLVRADRLLARAFELEPRGDHLAWRGFVRHTAFFQHRTTAFLKDDADAVELSVEALRHSPENAIVQAISAQLDYIHQGNLNTPLVMARRAVEINSTDPMAWALLSNALAANGLKPESYETAAHAVGLAVGSRIQYYFEHFACIAATALEDYDRARSHARMGLRLRPDFVSLRRYELALALWKGDVETTRLSVEAMRRHEPDFRAADLLQTDYPVTTLRRLPLIDVVGRRLAGADIPTAPGER